MRRPHPFYRIGPGRGAASADLVRAQALTADAARAVLVAVLFERASAESAGRWPHLQHTLEALAAATEAGEPYVFMEALRAARAALCIERRSCEDRLGRALVRAAERVVTVLVFEALSQLPRLRRYRPSGVPLHYEHDAYWDFNCPTNSVGIFRMATDVLRQWSLLRRLQARLWRWDRCERRLREENQRSLCRIAASAGAPGTGRLGVDRKGAAVRRYRKRQRAKEMRRVARAQDRASLCGQFS